MLQEFFPGLRFLEYTPKIFSDKLASSSKKFAWAKENFSGIKDGGCTQHGCRSSQGSRCVGV